MFKLLVFTCILLSGFPYLTSSTPVESTVSSGPRSVLDRIPLDKWGPAIDKLFGKVEDWRPIGVESVRIVEITTKSTGGTASPTTTTTIPTTTTTTTKPTTTTAGTTTTSAATTTTKPTTTTDLTTRPTNQGIKTHTLNILNKLQASNDIINRVTNGEKSNAAPTIKMGTYSVEDKEIPHNQTSGPPTLSFAALDERSKRKDEEVLGIYTVIMFDNNNDIPKEGKLHYIYSFTVGKDTDGNFVRVPIPKPEAIYKQPEQGSSNIITFVTFKRELMTQAPPENPNDNFDVKQFMDTYNLTVVDAISAAFI